MGLSIWIDQFSTFKDLNRNIGLMEQQRQRFIGTASTVLPHLIYLFHIVKNYHAVFQKKP